VVLAARSQTKLDAVKVDIETPLAAKGAKAQLTCLVCDLDDLDSAQKCTEESIAMKLPLHCHYLTNNAGIMALPERAVSPSFPSRARPHRVHLHPLLRDQTPCLAPAPSWPFARPPQEGWEQALLDLPEGEGAPGFALNSKSLSISAALRLVPVLPPATTRCCSPLCSTFYVLRKRTTMASLCASVWFEKAYCCTSVRNMESPG
jgi:hypothetical protein